MMLADLRDLPVREVVSRIVRQIFERELSLHGRLRPPLLLGCWSE